MRAIDLAIIAICILLAPHTTQRQAITASWLIILAVLIDWVAK